MGPSKLPPPAIVDDSDDESFDEKADDDHVSQSMSTGTGGDENNGELKRRAFRRVGFDVLAIFCSKIVVYVVLLMAAASVGTVTWYLTNDDETSSFESEFKLFAESIISTADIRANEIVSSLQTLSVDMTSYAKHQGVDVWPFVTLPDWEVHTQHIRSSSEIDMISFFPIVKASNRSAWGGYSVLNQGWIEEGLAIQGRTLSTPDQGIVPLIYSEHPELALNNYSAPTWQVGPAPDIPTNINRDFLTTTEEHQHLFSDMIAVPEPRVTAIFDGSTVYESFFTWYVDDLALDQYGHENHPYYVDDDDIDPTSSVYVPIYKDFKSNEVAGILAGSFSWDQYFFNMVPDGLNGFVVFLEDSCGSSFSYRIDGSRASYLGRGDLHDPEFTSLVVVHGFMRALTHNNCDYTIKVYAGQELKSFYESNQPAVYTSVVVMVFFFTALVFSLYDVLVTRRQSVVANAAARTQALVSSLFPKNVQQRILDDANEQAMLEQKSRITSGARGKNQLKEFLAGDNHEGEGDDEDKAFKTRPIADLFPETTVLFADIAGFTAWSSTREPSQVFTLLETIYHSFDEIAKRRRVFKVETVGDCYVAVTGLPEPRKDHAVVMARYARDCLAQMHQLTKKLEVQLGPDTTDLNMRFGLHSGPVTAGVLRGERARFQLFGDTVNTASRMETTGQRGLIQVSQETASLLMAAGKEHWVAPRSEKVYAKGKGELQTYWLSADTSENKAQSVATSEASAENMSPEEAEKKRLANEEEKMEMEVRTIEAKQQRLIDWNTALLSRQLALVIAQRKVLGCKPGPQYRITTMEKERDNAQGTILDEVVEVINLPKFDSRVGALDSNPKNLDEAVQIQLREYVQTVAAMYRENPFHNFEHASHVTMSTVKLLSRIVAPDMEMSGNNTRKVLHDHTYGITSDPITQFAVILAALIHDVDHSGVPNATLVREGARIATVYKGKSVAEQNSVDIAWDLLMDGAYTDLRRAIYQTEHEYRRFRQLIVNSVMATDIMDKDLGLQRKNRWNKAFTEGFNEREDQQTMINRKATIVIEHILQASDVAHTMQHWHIYRKWNERLFEELYMAYRDGRSAVSPADNWYQGEIGFFDFYIIPLAMKLKSCGVFGVSSDEYLLYAQQNRNEWERKGKEVVATLIDKYQKIHG